MKKILIVLSLFAATFSVMAETQQAFINIHRKKDTDGPKVHRTPMRIPIEVWYDTVSGTVEVSCSAEIDAQVILYDATGNIVGFSQFVNTELNLSGSGTYTIFIESDEWYAEGTIDA